MEYWGAVGVASEIEGDRQLHETALQSHKQASKVAFAFFGIFHGETVPDEPIAQFSRALPFYYLYYNFFDFRKARAIREAFTPVPASFGVGWVVRVAVYAKALD